MKVLVADDDQGIRTSIAAALRREGYVVQLAEDGVRALELLSGEAFDCAVLDVLMPAQAWRVHADQSIARPLRMPFESSAISFRNRTAPMGQPLERQACDLCVAAVVPGRQ